MLFIAVAPAVGEPNLFDPAHVERVDKPGDALGHQMRVVDGKRQFERRRPDTVEIMAPLLDRVGQVMDFGRVRLLVQVFEQDQRAMPFGIGDDALQPFEAGLYPHLLVGGEVKAGMHDDPFGAELGGDLDIGSEIAVDGVADMGRVFGDVDRRGGVQPKMDLTMPAGGADRGGAVAVEAAERVRAGVELNVDPMHRMSCRPFNRVLEPQLAPDIDADPVPQPHPPPLLAAVLTKPALPAAGVAPVWAGPLIRVDDRAQHDPALGGIGVAGSAMHRRPLVPHQ